MTFEWLPLDLSTPLDQRLFTARYEHALTDEATLVERAQVIYFFEARIRIARSDDEADSWRQFLEELWPAYAASCQAEIAANMDWGFANDTGEV